MAAMPPERSTPTLAAPGGHYSHATVANGFVFVSGQLPITPAGEKLVERVLRRAGAAGAGQRAGRARGCGSGIDQLVQVRVYVDNMDNWPGFNALYAQWAGDAKPSRAVVPTGPLHFGLKVEVEAVAVIG